MTTGRPPGQLDPARLVFVAGLHRSGTTALARVLAEHPEVSGFTGTSAKEDEGQHLQDVYPPARAHGGAGRFALAPAAHLTEASALATDDNARRLLDSWSPHWDLEQRLLLEKSPANLLMTRFLQRIFPGSAVVAVVRHPVTVSLSTRRWSGPTTGMSRLLEHWLHAHETFRADTTHLRRVHVVSYERLVTDSAAVLGGIGDFLGLTGPVPTGGLDGSRSDRYRTEWERMRTGRLERLRTDRLVRRYGERVAALGYRLDDLDHADPFPVAGTPAPSSAPDLS